MPDPTPLDSLADLAATFQERLDGSLAPLVAAHLAKGGHLHCRRGCGNCCQLAIHVPLPEALRIADRLPTVLEGPLDAYLERLRARTAGLTGWLPYLRTHRREVGLCPFLDAEGACGVYPLRPLTCRALLSTRPADWCAVDLAELDEWDRRQYLASLDPQTVAWPTHYLAEPQAQGRGLETELRDAMRTRCGFALSGNLPLLVWLLRRRGLAAAVARGAETVAALLAQEGFGGPPLVELERGGKEQQRDQQGYTGYSG